MPGPDTARHGFPTLDPDADAVNAFPPVFNETVESLDDILVVDGAAGVASLRTLGPGALQAAPGNDARLADQRTPRDGSVTSAKIVAGAVGSAALADDAVTGTKIATNAVGTAEIAADAVGTAEIATDAVTAAEIAAGAVGASEVAGALKPSGTAADGTEALRALGTSAGRAMPGNITALAVTSVTATTLTATSSVVTVGVVIGPNGGSIGVGGSGEFSYRTGVGADHFFRSVSSSGTVDGQVFAAGYPGTSGRAMKRNVKTIKDAVAKIERLRGVAFDWHLGTGEGLDGKPSVGLVAEEVEAVFPELVTRVAQPAHEVPVINDDGVPVIGEDGELVTRTVPAYEHVALNYMALVGPLVEAVKELSARLAAVEG